MNVNIVSHQGTLIDAIHSIFPNQRITHNARKQTALVNDDTGYFSEIDIYLPDINLGLEFQDAYHYIPIWYVNISLDQIKANDKCTARKNGTTLVYVPCWWSGDVGSLISTIWAHRPDLASLISEQNHFSSPIPLNPAPSFFLSETIPDVGSLMLASFVSSDSSFSQSLFLDQHWWVGEKYDGVHCVYNPYNKQLYARRGGKLDLDNRVLDAISNGISSLVEGELWNGRGMFLESQRIRNQSSTQDLPYARVVTFDDPSPRSHSMSFERRYRLMLGSVDNGHSIVAFRMKCLTTKVAHQWLKDIIEGGGEGLMLRKPKSIYEPGRSSSLLKLKAVQGDAEALVVSVRPNSLTLRLPNGAMFEVQQTFTEDLQPKKGDVVTFEFDHFVRRETPVNPQVTRVRKDIRWDDAVADYSNSSVQYSTNDRKIGLVSKTTRYWTTENFKNLRLFMENFARSRNLDPLLASSWYSISGKSFEQTEVRHIINHGGYIKTVVSLFPEIEFDVQQFANVQKGFWKELGNRKRIFDGLAQDQGFDPLIAQNWYSVPASLIFEKDANFFIIQYYRGNYHLALMHIYPDIGLQASLFKTQPRVVLDSKYARRRLFEDFAKENNFDPLVASNWYNIDESLIKSRRNAGLVLCHYQQNVPNALIDIFPEIGLKLYKFNIVPRNYWRRFKNRKDFFDNYAKKHGFDPLVASNWHKKETHELVSEKNAMAVFGYYKGNFRRALTAIYPTIGLKYELRDRGHWSKEQEQRKFLDDYARENNFDPLIPDNWYKVSFYAIITRKHGQAILAKYRNIKKALMTLYPNIGLKEDKFRYVGYLIHKSNKKKFFDNIATENEFDPTKLSNWHKFGERQIMSYQGIRHVIRPYQYDLWKALEDIYST